MAASLGGKFNLTSLPERTWCKIVRNRPITPTSYNAKLFKLKSAMQSPCSALLLDRSHEASPVLRVAI